MQKERYQFALLTRGSLWRTIKKKANKSELSAKLSGMIANFRPLTSMASKMALPYISKIQGVPA